ncbi:ZIP family metal transporter [Candidatus Woesearchaeota archaeon]|nr:ZIP family metal transporter [Candidatus Woesearchaeota archaeon]
MNHTALVWIYSIISVSIISLISLVGVIALSIKIERLKQILLFLVSFSAGALFGDALIQLLPQSFRDYGITVYISYYVLAGILFFFIAEKFIHWHHCHLHPDKTHPHPFVFMNLIGDAIHNFTDGMIIAASYVVSIPIGIATTIAVLLHEIPQEIGDFGVLLHGGMKTSKAVMLNFIVALTAVLGAVFALILNEYVAGINMFMIPFAAGGFIYIAGSDLIPELHKEVEMKKSFIQLASFVLGILLIVVSLKFS